MRPVLRSDEEDAEDGGSDFADLYRREQQSMIRLAVLLVGSRPVAEDVVQDAFAAVSTRWDELDRAGAYLRTTVVNGCRMVLRGPDAARSTPE